MHGMPLQQRLGLPIPQGVFNQKFKSVTLCIVGLCAALAVSRDSTQKRYHCAAIVLATAIFVHLTAKDIAALAIVGGLLLLFGRFNSRKARLSMWFAVVIAAVSLGPVVWPAIDERLDTFVTGERAENTVRNALYSGAIEIANERFPFGAGAGTFGSNPSRDMGYSPVYVQTGIVYLHGGGPGADGQFLMDTYWPKVLGEYGYIGFALFMVLFYKMAATGLNAFRKRQSVADTFGFLLFMALLTSSVATSVFTLFLAMPFIALSFALIWRAGSIAR